MKKIILFLILLLVVQAFFSIIYYLSRTTFAYSDPKNIHSSQAFLNKFFKETCGKSWKYKSHYIEETDSGCIYHYISPASAYLRPSLDYKSYVKYFPIGLDVNQPQLMDGLYVNFAMDLGTSYRFSFHSYENHLLQINFFRSATFEVDMHPDVQIRGMVNIDLSNLKGIGNPILVRFIPYIAFDDFLIKPIEQQSFEETENRPPIWGEVLGLGLLGFGQSGTPSMTVGREQSYWILNTRNELFLDLKNYFENGSMKHSEYSEFLIYSFQVLTASSTGQILPNSPNMRVLVALESVIGIIFLGFLIGLITEFLQRRTHK